MKKDIEWLKKEAPNLRGFAVLIDGEDGEWEPVTTVSVEDIYELINQLDKLEVLSQEFINEKAVEVYVDTEDAEVHVTFRMRDLQNLLVLKQDEREQLEIAYKDILSRREFLFDDKRYVVVEKPVIPKFVAEWIESRKNSYPFDVIGVYLRMNELSANEQTREVLSWVHESELNRGSFARAWTDGYAVEEEQKYYVINNDHRMMLVRMMDGKTITEADPFKLEDMYEAEKKSHRLTEQEIKDYDIRYWAFRKPVEEMEE